MVRSKTEKTVLIILAIATLPLWIPFVLFFLVLMLIMGWGCLMTEGIESLGRGWQKRE